ncbi:MAG: NUDIX domain-containing protein [Candidatus Moranbacteria bacterium]|nr:NUDIX domain-containing protein [Candidatus Moranbacteria bacterium]
MPKVKSKQIIATDIDNKRYKVDVKDLRFRPSVYAVIIKDHKVLLSKQWDGYDYPGGGLDLGESILEGLKRETFEESGVKIKPLDIVWIEDAFFRFTYPKENFVHSILIYYKARYLKGKPTNKYMADYEKKYMGKPEWIDIKKADKIKFYNQVDNKKLLAKALKI